MKKKATAFMLTFVMVISLVFGGVSFSNVASATETVDGDKIYEGMFTYKVDGDHAVVIKAIDDPWVTEITVPETIEGLPVTSVSVRAFQDLRYLKKLTIQAKITYLGDATIAESSAIEEVNLPDTIEDMHNSVRLNRRLKKINIPKNLKVIDNCFYGLPSLEEIEIPEGVERIERSFLYCDALEKVTIPNGCCVKSSSFNCCHSLLAMEFKGNSVYEDGLQDCPLVTAYLPGNKDEAEFSEVKLQEKGVASKMESAPDVHMISGTAEGYLYKLSPDESLCILTGTENVAPQNVTVPKTVAGHKVTHLAAGIFTWLGHRLETAVIEAEITELPAYCFDGCFELYSLTLPEGLTTLKKLSVRDNPKLTTLVLPDSVIKIEEEVFDHMEKSLTICTSAGTFMESYARERGMKYSIDGVVYGGEESVLIDGVYYLQESDGSLTVTGFAKRVDPNAEEETIIIPEIVDGAPVKKIRAMGFQSGYFNHNDQDGASMKHLIIQAGIEEIPAWCFGGLKLKSVVLPSIVRRIAQDAFDHNDTIESISLNEGLESIGEGAFYYLPRLKSISIPSTVTFIDQKAFESCIRLSSVYIPAEVKMDSTTFGEKNGYRLFHEDTFLIISAPAGSSAIAYAKANNIKYAEISEDKARTSDNQDIKAEVTDKVIDEFDEGQMLEIQSDKYDITFDEKATEIIENSHGDDSVLLNFEELSEEQAKNENAISDEVAKEIYDNDGYIVELELERDNEKKDDIIFSTANNTDKQSTVDNNTSKTDNKTSSETDNNKDTQTTENKDGEKENVQDGITSETSTTDENTTSKTEENKVSDETNNQGSVEVEIKIDKPEDTEDETWEVEEVVVEHIDDSGKVEEVPCTVDSVDDTVTFETTHFSKYAIKPKFVKVKKNKQEISGSSIFKKTVCDKAFSLDNHARTKITYKLKSGDSVSVTKNGKVTIKKTGTSKIVATAVSAYGYLAAKKTITIKVAEPKTIALKSVKKNGKGSVLLTWKKASNVTGYTIRYSTAKSMKGAKTITIKKASAIKQVIKKLSGKKKYYFQIQTYKTLNKKTYRSGWSKAGSCVIS